MKLDVQDLRTGYGSATIVNGVSLSLGHGESLALMGRNGMGKSTFVKGVLGYLPRTTGSVRFDGQQVVGWATHRIIRLGVGYAAQEENLFSDLSVGDNLDLGWAHGQGDLQHRREILEHFPVLGTRLRQPAGTLSGGEQRMLVLARALLMRPSILILDEVSDGLQPGMVTKVEQLLRAELQRGDLTLLMIEQNLDLSLRVCDRVSVLKLGELVFESAGAGDSIRSELAEQLAP